MFESERSEITIEMFLFTHPIKPRLLSFAQVFPKILDNVLPLFKFNL